MKLVLDTNVLVAAFITHGVCNELLEHCALHHQIILSSHILEEFKRVLTQKFAFSQYEVDEANRLLISKVILVKPDRLKRPVSRDCSDDFIIAAAVAGQCFCIVSGDKDLTDIGEYQGIRIITPAEFWKYEKTVKHPAASLPAKGGATGDQGRGAAYSAVAKPLAAKAGSLRNPAKPRAPSCPS